MKSGGDRKRDIVRGCVFSAFAGLITSFCYTAGYQLDRLDTLDLTDRRFYLIWAAAAAGCSVAVYFLWAGLDSVGRRWKRDECGERGKRRLAGTIFLFLCWIPALLSIFPGVFSYDAFDEWQQVHNWMITSHHPVAHVLLLGGLMEGFFRLTGSYNFGIAVYTILQMIVLAWALSSVVAFLAELGIPRFWRIFSLAFFALSPVAQLFSICATKDVLFTGAELFFLLYVIRFALNSEFAGDRKAMVRFGAAALCTMIFRNNGVYIVLLTLLILFFARRKSCRKYGKNLAVFLAVILVPYLLYTGPVYRMLSVTQGGVEEMLSVPLQQMARVYRYDRASLEEEELELLTGFVDQDCLEEYRPTVSDFVKKGFNREAFQADKKEFFGLWLRLGVSHPFTYINSFLINTVDAWYPHALIDGYRHGDGRGSWFDYRVAPPGEERIYLKGLHGFYETISHDLQAQKKPLAFLALSPGWYFLCTLLFSLYFWSRRRYGLLLPMTVFAVHMITVLLGPMILVRYLLLFFLAFPVAGAMALFPNCFEQEA